MLSKYKIIASWLVLALIGACGQETIEPRTDRLGLDFFPLETGQFRIYQVETVDFSLLGSDTSRFQMKEAVVDSFTNDAGDISYVIHRSNRADANDAFSLDSVWTARRSAAQAVFVENNVPIIKLVFPLSEGLEWDGNALNARNEQTFRMENLFQPSQSLDSIYQNTVTIVQSEVNDNLIIQDERTEVYAEGIGLIQKESIILNFCARQECLGQGEIEGGRILKLNLIVHGRE